jgi:hypothetical protein
VPALRSPQPTVRTGLCVCAGGTAQMAPLLPISLQFPAIQHNNDFVSLQAQVNPYKTALLNCILPPHPHTSVTVHKNDHIL